MIISAMESGGLKVVLLGDVSFVKVIHEIAMAMVGHKWQKHNECFSAPCWAWVLKKIFLSKLVFFLSARGLKMIAVSWAVKWDWSDHVWVKTYAFHSRTVLVQILKFHVHVLNLWPNAIHTKRDWVLIAIFPLQKGKRSARSHIQTQI